MSKKRFGPLGKIFQSDKEGEKTEPAASKVEESTLQGGKHLVTNHRHGN